MKVNFNFSKFNDSDTGLLKKKSETGLLKKKKGIFQVLFNGRGTYTH